LFTQLMLFSNTCGPMIAYPTDSTTPAVQLLHRPAEQLEVPLAAAADHRFR